MSDAPEKIHAWAGNESGGWVLSPSRNVLGDVTTEYVRADLHEALQARVAELEGALMPFADVADECDDWDMDDGNQAPIDAGQCRAARAALSQEKEG